jgi:succinyl-CoA synthetase beta subunit
MNIHEYQAKELLQRHGVAVPAGEVCESGAAARAAAEKLFAAGEKMVVVKSQIHAGGRGKGTFKSGFQGGVKLCRSAEDAGEKAAAMIGQVLVTKQTGPDGRLVRKVLVGAAPEIKKELYLAVLLDRNVGRPVVMASTEGGMDIEEVAAKTPEKIVRETIDPGQGFQAWQGRKIAAALGLRGELMGQAVKLLRGVYETWWASDASLVEINPLCIVDGADGKAHGWWRWMPRWGWTTTRCSGIRTCWRCAIWGRRRRWRSRPASTRSTTSSWTATSPAW